MRESRTSGESTSNFLQGTLRVGWATRITVVRHFIDTMAKYQSHNFDIKKENVRGSVLLSNVGEVLGRYFHLLNKPHINGRR